MAENNATLATIYQGWDNYQKLLTRAIAPLSAEQLALRPSPDLRTISDTVLHIVGARARWFELMGVGDEEFLAMGRWDRAGEPFRTASELVYGVETTWRVMQDALAGWTSEDMQMSWEDEGEIVTRQWIIWHLIEHDVHHGGEVSLLLGMNGLEAPDL